MVAPPSCTSPILWLLPVMYRTRSLKVVLPASMWAMTPKLRRLRIRLISGDSFLSDMLLEVGVEIGVAGLSGRIRGQRG